MPPGSWRNGWVPVDQRARFSDPPEVVGEALTPDFTADIIASFSTGVYQVTRHAPARYQQGRATAGNPYTFQVQASVQPASGRDLLRLEEGRRSIETKVVFVTTSLTTGGQDWPQEADRIDIAGRSWEVQLVETWPGYVRAIVQAVS